MKTNLKIFLIAIVVLTFASCKLSEKCKNKDANKGEIIENFMLPECYRVITWSDDDNCIIKSINDISITENCDSIIPLNVDFSKHSIIGQYVTGKCYMSVTKELIIDNNKKEFIYNIKVEDCGLCKKMAFSKQLVLVPVIPDDYDVVFELVYD